MNWADFIVVGENIHCSRIVKRGGIKTAALPGGGEAVKFTHGSAERLLRVPTDWEQRSPAFAEGKIKHVALAIYQSLHGNGEDRCVARRADARVDCLPEREKRDHVDGKVDEPAVEKPVGQEHQRRLQRIVRPPVRQQARPEAGIFIGRQAQTRDV